MITDITQAALTRALDGTALRHRAIANNIANVETPGFHRQAVDFEAELRAALDAPTLRVNGAQREVASVQPAVREDSAAPEREAGNNVDPDREMADLAENAIRYQSVLHAMSLKSAMVRTAIYEGRR